MSEIIKKLPFGINDIDTGNYTASLLNLCIANGLISEERQFDIKRIIDDEFGAALVQFTNGESNYVREESAAGIYRSVFYRADVCLQRMNDLEKQVDALINADFSRILSAGKEMILSIFNTTVEYHRAAKKTALHFGLEAYEDALGESFDQFYTSYDARFNAAETFNMISYPLMKCEAFEMNSLGVMYMHEYYYSLMVENIFCNFFTSASLMRLLSAYGATYSVGRRKSSFTGIQFNVAEAAFVNMLSVAMVSSNKKPTFSLSFGKEDYESFRAMFGFMAEQGICDEARNVLLRYSEIIPDERVFRYLHSYLPLYAENIKKRLDGGGLENYIIRTK